VRITARIRLYDDVTASCTIMHRPSPSVNRFVVMTTESGSPLCIRYVRRIVAVVIRRNRFNDALKNNRKRCNNPFPKSYVAIINQYYKARRTW